MPLIMLALQKAVQAELKLDSSQKDKLKTLDAELRKSMGGPIGGQRPPRQDAQDRDSRPVPPDASDDDDDRPEPPDFKGRDDKADPPDRSEAGDHRGPPGHGMQEPMAEAEKKLAEILSDKQLARLKQIALQLQGVRALLTSEEAKKLELTEEQREKIQRLSRRNAKALRSVLTTEQWKQWQEIVGEPFKGKIAFGPPGGRRPPR